MVEEVLETPYECFGFLHIMRFKLHQQDQEHEKKHQEKLRRKDEDKKKAQEEKEKGNIGHKGFSFGQHSTSNRLQFRPKAGAKKQELKSHAHVQEHVHHA